MDYVESTVSEAGKSFAISSKGGLFPFRDVKSGHLGNSPYQCSRCAAGNRAVCDPDRFTLTTLSRTRQSLSFQLRRPPQRISGCHSLDNICLQRLKVHLSQAADTDLRGFAIKVINAASREIEPRVHAMGIGSRNGELVIRIPTTHLDQFSVGDQLLAYQAHTSEQLGAVLMIEVDSDSCLCSVSDKMYNDRFWNADLEERMQFRTAKSPPQGRIFH